MLTEQANPFSSRVSRNILPDALDKISPILLDAPPGFFLRTAVHPKYRLFELKRCDVQLPDVTSAFHIALNVECDRIDNVAIVARPVILQHLGRRLIGQPVREELHDLEFRIQQLVDPKRDELAAPLLLRSGALRFKVPVLKTLVPTQVVVFEFLRGDDLFIQKCSQCVRHVILHVEDETILVFVRHEVAGIERGVLLLVPSVLFLIPGDVAWMEKAGTQRVQFQQRRIAVGMVISRVPVRFRKTIGKQEIQQDFVLIALRELFAELADHIDQRPAAGTASQTAANVKGDRGSVVVGKPFDQAIHHC